MIAPAGTSASGFFLFTCVVARKMLCCWQLRSNRPSMKSRRLLLVEDDEFLARLLKEKLEQERCQVTLAVDGQRALDALKTAPLPEVVILDLILPVVDGFEVLQNIRSNDDPAVKALPVIVLSNLGSAPDIQRVRDLGANEYLVKAQMTPGEIVDHVLRFTK